VQHCCTWHVLQQFVRVLKSCGHNGLVHVKSFACCGSASRCTSILSVAAHCVLGPNLLSCAFPYCSIICRCIQEGQCQQQQGQL
jgi:hypothetical protein